MNKCIVATVFVKSSPLYSILVHQAYCLGISIHSVVAGQAGGSYTVLWEGVQVGVRALVFAEFKIWQFFDEFGTAQPQLYKWLSAPQTLRVSFTNYWVHFCWNWRVETKYKFWIWGDGWCKLCNKLYANLTSNDHFNNRCKLWESMKFSWTLNLF